MQSKTSSSERGTASASFGPFNRTLFRKNLTRFWPLWAIYAIFWGVLMPLIQYSNLHAYAAYREAAYTSADLARSVLEMGAAPAVTMALIFSCLFAMGLFSYLCGPRSVGMMHSFPIRREGVFLTNYLSGLFMLISTHAVIFALTALVQISSPAGFAAWGALWLWLAVTSCLSVFFFSFAVFCAMFTGQILAIPAFYGILNVLVIGVEWLVRTFAGLFLYGINGSGGYSETALWLSPAAYLYSRLRLVVDRDLTGGVISTSLSSDGLRSVWIFAAAGVVLAALALIAYRRRRSESAGDTVSVGWAKPLFKYGVAVCSALGLGQGVYFLTWGQYRGSGEYSLSGVLVCMLLMGLVGYFAAEMLLRKSFRVWKAAWKGAAVLAAVLAALCVTTSLDLLNIEGRVPAADEIESVQMGVSGENYLNFETKNAALINAVSAAHRQIVAEKAEQQERVRNERYAEESTGRHYTGVSLTYTFKNGSVMKRDYTLYFSKEDVESAGSAAALLTDVCSQPEAQMSGLFDESRITDVTGGEYNYFVSTETGGTYYNREITAEQGRALYDAVLEDIAAGRFGGNSIAQDETLSYACNLYLYCLSTDPNNRTYYASISPNADSTATIAALKAQGLVTEENPLVTVERANRDDGRTKDAVVAAKTGTSEAQVPAAQVPTAQVLTAEN